MKDGNVHLKQRKKERCISVDDEREIEPDTSNAQCKILLINPRRACARVTVLVLSVCLCVCVFPILAPRAIRPVSATSARYGHEI